MESTCDETAVAVTENGRKVLTDQIFSQADLHAVYGGVVPEIASRSHVEVISRLADRAIAAAGVKKSELDAVAGGVAANSRIRADFAAAAEKAGAQLFVPPLRLCGDNAAMIGCQGYYEFLAGHTAGPELNAYATMPLEKQIG